MYHTVPKIYHWNILGRRTVTFSGKSQRTPIEEEGINLEGLDRDKPIKFEKVCFLTKTKILLLYTVYWQMC